MASYWRNREPVRAVLLAAILTGACDDRVDPEPEPFEPVAAASATVPGLGLHSAGSGRSSSNKSAVVGCPEGQSVLGMGGRTRGGKGRVVMDAMIPRAPGEDDVTVHASEVGSGTAEEWSVVAYAICANVPTIVQGRIGQVSSISPRVTEIGISDNPCSLQDQVLTGVGGEILNAPAGGILLEAMIPSADLEGSTARAVEHPPGTTADWRLDADAICADLPGLQRVVVTSLSTSKDKHVTARCPVGAQVVGTGGEIIGGQGHVVITYILPEADLTRVHVRGGEDAEGTTTNWAVRAYAVCATA